MFAAGHRAAAGPTVSLWDPWDDQPNYGWAGQDNADSPLVRIFCSGGQRPLFVRMLEQVSKGTNVLRNIWRRHWNWDACPRALLSAKEGTSTKMPSQNTVKIIAKLCRHLQQAVGWGAGWHCSRCAGALSPAPARYTCVICMGGCHQQYPNNIFLDFKWWDSLRTPIGRRNLGPVDGSWTLHWVQ